METRVYEPISTFVELKNIDIRKLYNEYIISYQKIHQYANKIRKGYVNTTDKDKINERRTVYDVEKELLEVILWLEKYLPYEKREYTKKQAQETKRLTFDKKSNVGFTPLDNYTDKIEKIVENKILKNELLYIIKTLLSDKQYSCVYLYFWEGMTQEEIAKKLGISKSEVNQKIQVSIDKIKNSEYFLSILENLL